MSEFKKAALPENEVERLAKLHDYHILDTAREAIFDELASLISYICKVPMALITFMDKDRQWHKSKIGILETASKREESFCQYAILEKEIYEIPDTEKDEIFKNNPNVYGSLGIKFYASASLNTVEGHAIGNICVMDNAPRKLTAEQKKGLQTVARQVMTQLELRRINLDLKQEIESLLTEKIQDTRNRLEQKEAEANYLKQSLDKSNATITLDLEANITHVNEHFCELTGYKAEELIGQSRSMLVDPTDKQQNLQALWSKLKDGKYHNGLFKLQAKNGDTKWVLSNYNPIKDSEGNLVRILNIVQDVTNEETYKRALEVAKKTAEQAVVAKDNFLSNMSHEIRTPLNAIIGFTDILKNEPLDEEHLDHVNTISKASDNLLNLINDILDLSKIESGKFKLEQANFNMADVFSNVQKIFIAKARNKNIKLNTHFLNDNPFWVSGDEYRLNQILFNLINNAIKFTEKGEVEITAKMIRKSDKKHILECNIKDSGIGISANAQKSIFERFTQADSDTTRKFGGTGLGLNIVKLLINNFKGEISLESTLGKGSTFSIAIPFSLGIGQHEFITTSDQKIEEHSNKEAVILMVEDNILNQKLGKHLIQNFGYTFEVVNNGEEGLEWLTKHKADLILMDLQMPEMDGYEAAEHIRNKLKLSTPIIAMTAHSIGAEREKCLSLGMDDYITKPFKIDAFKQLIEKWLHYDRNEAAQDSSKLFDLTSLENLAENDLQFVTEMTDFFIKQTPKELSILSKALERKEYDEVGQIAHKLKSSYKLIGFSKMNLLNALENMSKEKGRHQEINQLVNDLKTDTRQLIDELIAH